MTLHATLAFIALTLPLGSAVGQVEFCAIPGGSSTAAVTLDISGGDDGTACLTFQHQSSPDNALVGIYIECDLDPPFLEDTVVINGKGVEFHAGGSPPELPNGRTLRPAFRTDFHFTAAPPGPVNGVGPGELVALCFCMPDGMTSADLEAMVASGEIRIGLRVTAGEESGSFVSPRCPADFNCDWALDANDFAAFQRAWLRADADADFDGNGTLDVKDFIAFHAQFGACGRR